MSKIILQIDGKEVKAAEEMTILEAAQQADITIPTLCHHEKLAPYGGCRRCARSRWKPGEGQKTVAACLYPVEPDLIVRTRSKRIDKIRKMILELLLAHAPDSEKIAGSGGGIWGGQEPL